jgi:hypothetical protein
VLASASSTINLCCHPPPCVGPCDECDTFLTLEKRQKTLLLSYFPSQIPWDLSSPWGSIWGKVMCSHVWSLQETSGLTAWDLFSYHHHSVQEMIWNIQQELNKSSVRKGQIEKLSQQNVLSDGMRLFSRYFLCTFKFLYGLDVLVRQVFIERTDTTSTLWAHFINFIQRTLSNLLSEHDNI